MPVRGKLEGRLKLLSGRLSAVRAGSLHFSLTDDPFRQSERTVRVAVDFHRAPRTSLVYGRFIGFGTSARQVGGVFRFDTRSAEVLLCGDGGLHGEWTRAPGAQARVAATDFDRANVTDDILPVLESGPRCDCNYGEGAWERMLESCASFCLFPPENLAAMRRFGNGFLAFRGGAAAWALVARLSESWPLQARFRASEYSRVRSCRSAADC